MSTGMLRHREYNDERRVTRIKGVPVQVTFSGGLAQGTITSMYPRLSDTLMETVDFIELSDATVLPSRATQPLARNSEVYLNRNEILFIIDLTPGEVAVPQAHVLREVVGATINIDNYWISGQIHIPSGTDPDRFLLSSPSKRFLPITGGRFCNSSDSPQTFLVNRERICSLIIHGLSKE